MRGAIDDAIPLLTRHSSKPFANLLGDRNMISAHLGVVSESAKSNEFSKASLFYILLLYKNFAPQLSIVA